MLKIISLVVLVAIAGVLIAAAYRPDTFRVERTVRIAAAPDRIHPLINDLRQFNAWNPFNKKYPQIQGTYRGPAAGPGAAYDFKGNKEVGAGSVSITDTAPQKITMALDMAEPIEAHNTVVFSLVPQGPATDVTWAMQGRVPYVGKLLHMVFDMDKMVGGAFETGLADLKALAEKK
jgi:inosine-uridine nucleoside N-ribohydrolase